MNLGAIRALLSSRGRLVAIRYLAVATAANLLWEASQLPLYTIWTTASRGDLAYAAIHCTGGDGLILLLGLALALLFAGDGTWPNEGYARVALVATLVGVSYAIVSEWLNVRVLQNWAYAPAMPLVPPFGTGLSPLTQWIVIPPAALMLVRPSRSRTAALG
ncbi:MAG TPA: hypothetical protein VET85_15480 [Stellaceae bacterium]|nr:hypothetical protein [Stellaceae bacterium]